MDNGVGFGVIVYIYILRNIEMVMIIKVLLILKTRGEVIFFLQCENFCIRDLKIFLEDLFDEKNWHTLDNFFF